MNRTERHCRENCSSFILARLIASFNDLGLNMWIPSEISGFNPPMNVPIKAFWVHPWTLLPSISKPFWYSHNFPFYFILDKASSKSSQSMGPKRTHNSLVKILQVITLYSSLYMRNNHYHHWLVSPFKWKEARENFWSSLFPWNSRNWPTLLNHSIGSSPE